MNLCICVYFLTGRYIATDAFNRSKHEWPVHPNRLFSAAVAALHDQDELDPNEREALLWLETLGAPAIYAPNATARSVLTHYVPTNDASIICLSNLSNRYKRLTDALEKLKTATIDKKILSIQKKIDKERNTEKTLAWDGKITQTNILPERRIKQARYYPSVTPEQPIQWFIWKDLDQNLIKQHQNALNQLLKRITRLGHSSSLVAVSLGDFKEQPNWIPDKTGTHKLRTITPGQLNRLEKEFSERAYHVLQKNTETELFSDINPRIMPNQLTNYRHGESSTQQIAQSNEAGEWIIFEYQSGKRFTITQTWEACHAFKSALISHLNNPTLPDLSEHKPDQITNILNSIKVIAPAYIKGKYASGIAMGIVLILPNTPNNDDYKNLYRAIANWEQDSGNDNIVRLLTASKAQMSFQRVLQPQRKTMLPETWARPSKLWETITPIALNHNPRYFGHLNTNKHQESVQRAINSIKKACQDQQLPEPLQIEISRAPFFRESADAKAFPPVYTNETKRFLIHARLLFPQPVAGPLVLGAGRFCGMGLCLPGDYE